MKLKSIALAAVSVTLLASLTACSEGDQATPTSMCAFRIGDGQDGRNADVKEVIYPGFVVKRERDGAGDFEDEVQYFPCNARNFIVNDGKQTNVDGKKVGDWFEPAVGYTKEGTKVNVYYSMYWTPNQTASVQKDSFYPFCYKYTCYTTDDSKAGNANFSTEGWNGMLGENFPQAAGAIVIRDSKKVLTDASWNEKHDTNEWDKLATQLSENFAAEIRANTGVADDMFCGSGNSGWSDPKKPGEGEFTCTNVRFKVTSIVNADPKGQKIADGQAQQNLQEETNAAALKAAQAKYGEMAPYWLGLQDTLDKCAAENITCVVTLGSDGKPSINLPQTTKK